MQNAAATITASTTHHHCSTEKALLNSQPAVRDDTVGGWAAAWCAADQNAPGQWLQIDLNSVTSIAGVITQGRVGGQGQWVTSYKLTFSSDGAVWDTYTEQGQEKVFEGNTDRSTEVEHLLVPPVTARFVRFNPLTWYIWASMRMEVLLCDSADAVGLWPLNAQYGASDATGSGNDGVARGTQLAPGPNGDANGAFKFSGTANSYIDIPNNGRLDVRSSYTMLAHIYPTGAAGPIFNYVGNNLRGQWAVHFWQTTPQGLFMRAVERDGQSTPHVVSNVLQQNAWNYVGGTYDSSTGLASIWWDGEVVGEVQIGMQTVASQYPIRVAAREGEARYFAGRMACLQLYNYAMTQ
ncbi:uncharacterized protein [Branchiostoma lanceolatum]|uniref:uncharacterized protein n=1 Tax=Branchiostoma lanceolatum TaxID=7740 RepID=UPI003451C444